MKSLNDYISGLSLMEIDNKRRYRRIKHDQQNKEKQMKDMTIPGKFEFNLHRSIHDHWKNFKSWLKEQHLQGNDMLGAGKCNFIAFNKSHVIKPEPSHLQIRDDTIQVVHIPSEGGNPGYYNFLSSECNSNIIQLQIAWARHFFLPIEEQDYCVCEECKKLIPDEDIRHFHFESGDSHSVPRICSDCAEKP